jgi:hypothetical protein
VFERSPCCQLDVRARPLADGRAPTPCLLATDRGHAAPAVRLASPRPDGDAHRWSCKLTLGEPGRLVGSRFIDPSEQIMVLLYIAGCRARHERGWHADIADAPAAAQVSLLAHLSLSGARPDNSARPTMPRLVG